MEPRRSPTATRTVLSSILSPKLEMGRACSQAPDSLVETAKRRALVMSSGALSKRDSAVVDTTDELSLSHLKAWLRFAFRNSAVRCRKKN